MLQLSCKTASNLILALISDQSFKGGGGGVVVMVLVVVMGKEGWFEMTARILTHWQTLP